MDLKNLLSNRNPGLVKEWHHKKNSGLTPKDVTCGSNKKVWWKCAKGHEWQAIIANRTKGKGCPYCANKLVGKDNSLFAKFPELAKEWNGLKNQTLTPQEVVPGSSRRVWWKCEKGHEWFASINNRVNGRGCPYCKNRKVGRDNSLAVKMPELAAQWNFEKNTNFTPYDIVPGSAKKVWWKCRKGHEWQANLFTRANGVGCPYCSPSTSRMELRLYSELKCLFDDVRLREKLFGVECDIYIRDINAAVEFDGSYWHREKHDQDVRKNKILVSHGVPLLRVREAGLRKISGHDIICSKTIDDYKLVSQVLRHLMTISVMHAKESSRVEAYLRGGKICNEEEFIELYSSLPSALPGKSLFDLRPILSKQWSPNRNGSLTPKDVTIGSGIKVWWKCEKGHEWQASIANRVNGHGCPYCVNQKVAPENSLASLNPSLAKEWHPQKNIGLFPFQISPKANRKVWWQCSKGHEWRSVVSSRANGHGCPYCANKRANSENSLEFVNLELARQWNYKKNNGLKPSDVLPGSERKVWWRCERQHEWAARISSRTRGTGCPYCSNKSVNNENSLAAKNAALAKQWHTAKNGELTPNNVTQWSNKKVWWMCPKGHEWLALIANRSKGNGCPICANNFGRSGGKRKV